ncbi:MAG: RsmE family RNA methyltransferase [Proteobacteria bacterium]|nr:RsmE family RNA methyltransferase [Pseudomonadota bacterium]
MPSFFVDEINGNYVYIKNPDELKHFKVKRIKIGEPVSLIDGRGSLFYTIFEFADKREAKFSILKTKKKHYRVLKTFYIGFTDWKKMEFIAEKAGEMGVKAFTFFRGDKTERYSKAPDADKIKKKVMSGMKQSDNPNMPDYLGVYDSIYDITLTKNTIVLIPGGELNLSENVPDVNNVIIGPREGFSLREIEYFKDAEILTVNLDDSVYRVETAFVIASFLLKS